MGTLAKKASFLACLFFLILPSLFSQNAFITTWKTDNPGTSNNDQITIPGTGTYDIYWEEIGHPANNFYLLGLDDVETITFSSPGTYRVEITGSFTRIQFANGGDKEKLLTIEQWGNMAWTSMRQAFDGCVNLTSSASDAPDLSAVTDLAKMFKDCSAFNGAIGNWDVSQVVDIDSMFFNALLFNQDIGGWLVNNVTTMRWTFFSADAFNQDISNWNVGQVSSFRGLFYRADSFNQDIGGWVVSNATDFNGMFLEASSFNQDISSWDVGNAASFFHTFHLASSFDQYLGNWDVGNVTDMEYMFDGSGMSMGSYDATLIDWAAQSVQPNVDLGAAGLEYCLGTDARNSLIGTHGWNITGDTTLADCSFFTHWKTDNPGTSNNDQITIPGTGGYVVYWEKQDHPGINGLFTASGSETITFPSAGVYLVKTSGLERIVFNNSGDREKLTHIKKWGGGQWSSFQNAFNGCSNLFIHANDIPDLSNVTSMNNMFKDCTSITTFNIASWDISNVTDMGGLFSGAAIFNVNLGNWDVGNVQKMDGMFRDCPLFNRDISGWDVGNVQQMYDMFRNATSFDQNLGGWDISNVSAMGNMLNNSGLSQQNYDLALIGWAGQNAKPSVNLGAEGLQYCLGKTARDSLVSTRGWNITGDAPVGNCTPFTATWKTDNPGTSNPGQITVPATGSYDIYWEEVGNPANSGLLFDTSNAVTISFPTPGIYRVSLVGNLNRIIFNDGGDKDKILDIEQWGDTQWSSFQNAFSGCSNLAISATDKPDLSGVTNISRMFKGDTSLTTGNFAAWDLSNITEMAGLFSGATNFNGNVGSWDLGSATLMSGVFRDCAVFNQDISGWDVGNASQMFNMFRGASSFNQDISGWNTSSATEMYSMFRNAPNFDQNLGNWDISNVVAMANMLNNSGLSNENYDLTLIGWASQSAVPSLNLGASGLEYCLGKTARSILTDTLGWNITGDVLAASCDPFVTIWKTDSPGPSNNHQITIPATGSYDIYWEEVGNPHNQGVNLYANNSTTLTFPSPGTYRVEISGGLSQVQFDYGGDRQKILSIEQWGNIVWENMKSAFFGCVNLSSNATDAPDLSGVSNFEEIFRGCSSFNGDLGGWDVSNVTNMKLAFKNATSFNQNLNNWNVSNVTDMEEMFGGAASFDGDISSWEVGKVTNMKLLFAGTPFNQDISGWNTAKVTKMGSMFQNNTAFNQDISGWGLGQVQFMGFMFNNASAFNQDIGGWNTSTVTKMESMFEGATAFDQNLGGWDISGLNNLQNMLDSCGLSLENYDSTLIGWAAQAVKPNVSLGANGLKYCLGEAARDSLIQNQNWNFAGDSEACPPISLSAKILLQGPLLSPATPGLMNDGLRLGNYLPTTSPYPDGLACDSSVFDTTGANAIVDWVWVVLRSAVDTSVVVSTSALLQRDGDVVAVDGLSPLVFPQAPGSFFIAVSHRSHLSILSASAQTFGTSPLAFDFTSSLGNIYGGANSVADLPAGYALIGGDVDDNGQVQNTDVTDLIPQLGNSGYFDSDIDMNGQVQNAELNNLLLLNLGKGEQF